MVAYPRYSSATAGRLLDETRALKCADAAIEYPDYYRRHAHFLPGGYLSKRGARWYGQVIAPLYYQFREGPALASVVNLLSAMGAREVLELGCGPGSLLRRLLAGLPEASVTGVDLSPRLLEAAGRSGGGVLHADAASVPREDASADAIVACHLLGHVPVEHGEDILREAARLLRPGGALVLLEHSWHTIHTPGFTVRSRERLNGGLLALTMLAST